MLILLDIGNTHTHVGLASVSEVLRQTDIPTAAWANGAAPKLIAKFLGKKKIAGASFCSVVPKASTFARRYLGKAAPKFVELTHRTLQGIGIDYPAPATIGPDRLANALAARSFFGAPSVVVDFGTAVTFDVVNTRGNYAGGVIAPGLSAMTDYLHEKTALLPRIKIREIRTVVGKSTTEAMLIGAVHGYRGLIKELITEIKRELRAPELPVIATGGYAKLISTEIPAITAVMPSLTLEGLRLLWLAATQPK